MHKLFILSGSSGVGKSTLLNKLVQEGLCDSIPKYSNRRNFSTVDDVISVEDSKSGACDLVYNMYGNWYGFNSETLVERVCNKNQILITNDEETIKKIRNLLKKNVVVIYIVSDVGKNQLMKIYQNRYGYPSIKDVTDEINEEIEMCQKMVINDNPKGVIKCIENINCHIESIMYRDEEFKLRYNSIKQRIKKYTDNILLYDYVVMNFYSENTSMYAIDFAYDQIKQIGKEESKGEIIYE